MLLEAHDLGKTFRTGWVRRRRSFSMGKVHIYLRQGETIGIVGESGSGKTTLGLMLAGLLKPDTGQIFFKGDRVEQKSVKNLINKLVKEEGISKMIIQADKDVKHGRVIEIMDISKSAGIKSIIIAARWKDNQPD